MSQLDAAYKAYFNDADLDQDGILNFMELSHSLRSNGYTITDFEILSLFKFIDVDGDKRITFDEFVNAMEAKDDDFHKEALMRHVFNMLDADGNGHIESSELSKAFEELGNFMSAKEVQTIMEKADTDKSGTIEYEEFIAYAFGDN